MSAITFSLCASLFLCIATGCLRAQTTPAFSRNSGSTQDLGGTPQTILTYGDYPVSAPLSKVGTWDFSVWGRQAVGNSAYGDVGDVYVSMAGFRTGYVFARPAQNGALRGTLEYFFDIIPVFVLTKPQVIYGGGLSPVGFKWNFSRRYQPYVGLSLGGILSTRDVPPGNTSSLNFTVTAEGGFTILSRPGHALTASVGYWHFSNADTGATNPSLNAFTFGMEYHWLRVR